MKNFEYAAPRTESEAVALLSDQPGHTEILAGGTDLVGLMKKMVVQPERVVYIGGVPSMKGVAPTADGGVRIGAGTTLDEVLDSPYVQAYPGITQAIRGINSMQLQCQGTFGGDICQRARCWFFRNGHGLLADGGRIAADGAGELHAIFGNRGSARFVNGSRIAPALIALGAEARVIGPAEGEEHLIPLDAFFRTPRHERERETVLEPNQLLTHVVLPPASGHSGAYEVRHGEGPDYPLAASAASLDIRGGVVRDARVVLGQVAPIPWVSQAAADAIRGLAVSEATAEAAGDAAVADATPLSQNEYKVQLAKVAVKRAILLAAGLETGGF
ncbi:MAG: FAD binding domain-containing protein [Pirellulaceae bacterium]